MNIYSHEELVQKIKEAILEKHPELADGREILDNMDMIIQITRELSDLIMFDFDSMESDSEYYFICVYVSKINRPVIYDYHAPSDYENIDDLAETLADYQERITELENKITITK